MNGALILAGGKSERMHFPKAYLLYKGKTFLENIVDEYYQAGIHKIFVVLNAEFSYGQWEKYIDQVSSKVTIIENPNPEFGRFHSLKLGIRNMLNLEFCFIQNIDNPFVNKEVIENLMEARTSFGYTSPVYNGRNGHPVLISKKIIHHLNTLPNENLNLRSILSGFPKNEVEISNDDILININTSDDYERYVMEKVVV